MSSKNENLKCEVGPAKPSLRKEGNEDGEWG